MHELSLVRSLLDLVEEMGSEQGFARVNVLRLSCGRMACVDPKALQFAFAVESPGFRAQGARLEFELLPAILYCFPCEDRREISSHELQCPFCGGREVLLVGGTEELKLIEMEVD